MTLGRGAGMCQSGDFEYWRWDAGDTTPSVSVEPNVEPSFTLRIHPYPWHRLGDESVCEMTAEPDPNGDPTCCHVKAIRGKMWSGVREQLARILIGWGYEWVKWERRDEGRPRSYRYQLSRFLLRA